jgi:hypothetical protein
VANRQRLDREARPSWVIERSSEQVDIGDL